MDRLICIRHGHTTGDTEDRYGGWYDDALSPEGQQQAAALAKELAGEGIDAIHCSTLVRAFQTAIIAANDAAIHANEDLRERNQYGVLSGLTKAEAKTQFPHLVETVKDRLNTIEGAESYDAFRDRVGKAFITITADAAPGTVAIVWHGGGMRTLFRDILKIGELSEVGDCSWVELLRDGAGWKVGRMVRLQTA